MSSTCIAVIIIISFLAGIILGFIIGQDYDELRKTYGSIVVDPLAKDFKLELDDENALEELLHGKNKIIFRVERTTDTTNQILNE